MVRKLEDTSVVFSPGNMLISNIFKVILNKNNIKLTKSLKISCFKTKSNVCKNWQFGVKNCTDLLFNPWNCQNQMTASLAEKLRNNWETFLHFLSTSSTNNKHIFENFNQRKLDENTFHRKRIESIWVQCNTFYKRKWFISRKEQ